MKIKLKKATKLINIIMLFHILLISCKDVKEKETLNTSKPTSTVINEKDIETINFEDIKFLTELKKKYDYKNDWDKRTEKDKVETGCYEWEITSKQVVEIFQKMKLVDDQNWYMLCSIYPCYFTASVEFCGKICDIFINGGGYFSFKCEENKFSKVFVLMEKSDFFIAVCNPELYGN